MRILFVNAKPDLVRTMRLRSGVEPFGLWPRRHDFGELLDPQRDEAEFYDGGAKTSPRAVWQMRKIIRRLRPDIVHAFYGRALAHVMLATAGPGARPDVVSFRGIASRLSRFDAGDWLSYGHPRVAVHACESDAVRNCLIQSGIAAERCRTIYNFMGVPPKERPGRAALAEFDIPPGAFVVGTVATMRRVKGIDLLVRAAIECRDLPDVYWLLIGRVADPEVARLAADPRIAGRVRLAGHRPDASSLVSGADLFVMPSRSEALCQSLLEAMHQGVCPLVSDAGGMKEVVRHGAEGLVVPSEDVAALAGVIRSLHTDRPLVGRLADAAARRVAEEFTADRMADRAMAIYAELSADRSGREAA